MTVHRWKITHEAHRYIFQHTQVLFLRRPRDLQLVPSLEHYNKRKKIKFELMDVMPVIMMAESLHLYTHVNFTARSTKEGSREQLFFAELENCSKRRAPSRFIVTCCEQLGSDSTVGQKGFQLDYGTSAVWKNVDFSYCFACGLRMAHPRGDKYISGHCNVPHIYTNTC
uniref:DUF3615 domain-containing protein n=1 Tax=Setaria viridis TaxID=4556 RepID=A0A4U6TMN1_SETVI|nr:hypothetical protein SEVIR_8G233300v2 [Setaria viridis]